MGVPSLTWSAARFVRRALTRRVRASSFQNTSSLPVPIGWGILLPCAVLVGVDNADAAPKSKSTPTAVESIPYPSADLSGTWNASALKEAWSFPAWPEACGPKPAGLGAAGGTTEVVEQGGELLFSGAGKFKTTDCWDQSTGIRRVTHAQNQRAWTNTCKTPSSDPRQVNLQTSIVASDSRITLREVGHYAYQHDGVTCEADVVRSRTYSRNLDGNENADEARRQSEATRSLSASAPPDDSTPRPEPGGAKANGVECTSPGEPTELRFVNLIQWVEPGSSVQVTAQALDKDGCTTRAAVHYSLEPNVGVVTLGERTGLLRVASTAEQQSVSVVARSGTLSKTLTLPIVPKESRSVLLHAPGDEPVQVTTASQPVADPLIGSAATRAQDRAVERKWWFAGLAGLIVVGLATLGLRLLRAGSRSGSDAPPPRPSANPGPLDSPSVHPYSGQNTARPSISKGEIAIRDLGKTDPGFRRPTSGSVFTHQDGPDSELPVTQSNRNSPPFNKRESFCPRCGTRYIDGSLYCGVDGERLL